MSAKSIIKVVNLQFIPDLLELPIGSEIEIRVLSHLDTALYPSSSRKFIISCSEFETPELYPGDTFKWKFPFPGRYNLQCPLYSWMRCQINIIANENPQDPDFFMHKPQVKVQTKNKSTQVHNKTSINKLPSIASSVASEEETSEHMPNDEGISQEIEELFLQVKAECEKDRVGPANFLQEIEEEEVIFETREKITRNKDVVNVEREEKKGKVVFTTIAMAPAKYFTGYKEKVKKDKAKSKANKVEKKFRRKLRNDLDLAFYVLKLVVRVKKVRMLKEEIGLEKDLKTLEAEFFKVSNSMSAAMIKKIEIFWNEPDFKGTQEFFDEDLFLKGLACRLFGLNWLWWASDLMLVKEGDNSKFSSDLNEKVLEKWISQRKNYLGWKNGVLG